MTTGGTYRLEALVENKGNEAASSVLINFYLSPGGTTLPTATPVADALVDLGAAGSAGAKAWAQSGDIVAPNSAGHYCLVAEAVDSNDCNPPRNGGAFDPANRDQVAQRNIEIVTPPPPPPPPNPSQPTPDGMSPHFFMMPIDIATDVERRRSIRIRAVVDDKPTEGLLRALNLGDRTRIAERAGVEVALLDRATRVPFLEGDPEAVDPRKGLALTVEPRVPLRVFLAVRAVPADPDGVTIVHVVEEDAAGRRRVPLGGRTYVFATGKARGLERSLRLGKAKAARKSSKKR